MQFVPSDNDREPARNDAVSRHAALWISGLFKSFRHVQAVAGLDLVVAHGEILCLLGPSGCGKTTAPRVIAGFDTPDTGTIQIGDRVAFGPRANEAPEKRRVGMVFQEGALFPHLMVAQNVAFGLPRGGRRNEKVAEALRMVDLEGYDRRYPHQLSGGQQQRAALARALAPEPDLLLMDEPFSSLDAGLRRQLRVEVRSIFKKRRATVVCVTHDQDEAMQLSDRVALMDQGRIVQIGAPERIFNSPDTKFVAEFFGTADFLPAWRYGDFLTGVVGLVPWSDQWTTSLPAHAELEIMVRPDCVDIAPDEAGNGFVVERQFLGAFNLYAADLMSGRRVQVMQPHIARFEIGKRVRIFLREGHSPQPFLNGRALGSNNHDAPGADTARP